MSRKEAAPAGLEVDIELELERFPLSLSFQTQEVVTGIFGASGSGKTSLLEVIAGVRGKASGRIAMNTTLWADSATKTFVRPEDRGIGYVPQDGLLFPHLKVEQNLLSGQRRARRRGVDVRATFDRAVDLLDIAPLLSRSVQTLSGGERQRVALGRALCSGAELLLLDEPFAALDRGLRSKLLPYLRRLRSEFRTPMLFVSHDHAEVQALCDDLLVLKDGQLLAQGPPQEILTRESIFSLIDLHGYENVLPGTRSREAAAEGKLRLHPSDCGIDICFPAAPGVATDELLLGIPARDIILARERPRGLSARNILPATILEMRRVPEGELVLAQIHPTIPALAVELTESSSESLDLHLGSEVHLIFKASACRVYGSGG